MKVKIPAELKVGIFKYRIKHIPNLHRDGNIYGRVCSNAEVLELDLDLPDRTIYITFLHENIHIIQDVFGIKLSDDDVDRLAQGLAQVLLNNLGIEFDFSDIKEEIE